MPKNNNIETYYLLDTNEIIDASTKILKIKLKFIFDQFLRSNRLKKIINKNADYNEIFNTSFADSPSIRYWLTCSIDLIKSINSDFDPRPSSIACLHVDNFHPDRVIELHLLELISIYIGNQINNNSSFKLKVSMKVPNEIKLGNLGVLNCEEYRNCTRTRIEFNGIDKLSFQFDNNKVITIKIKNNKILNGQSFISIPLIYEFKDILFSVPIHDRALSEPYYANASIVRSKYACIDWIEKALIPSLKILSSIDKNITQECLKLSPAILPLHCGSTGFGSASAEDILGLIYLPGIYTQYDVAECFLHEAMHQKLFRFESNIDIFDKKSDKRELYYSPWRIDPRPFRMILHGSYVFSAISEMWLNLKNTDSYDNKNGDSAFLAYYRACQALIGIDVIEKYAKLSDIGLELVTSIKDICNNVRINSKPNNEIKKHSDNLLNQHIQRYPSYLK